MEIKDLVKTGDIYHLTAPECGEEYVIIDGPKFEAVIAEWDAFKVENIYGDEVDLALDKEGNFYVINSDVYAEIEAPAGCIDGLATIYSRWLRFED